MLSGERAFHGDSAADTMSAILRDEPPDLTHSDPKISPSLERIVRHCLEKNPEQRFQSAFDLAFDLEALSVRPAAIDATTIPADEPRRWLLFAAVATAVVAVCVAGAWEN
jgi:serine/threonine protein kinase